MDVHLFVVSDGFDAKNRQHKQLVLCLLMTASDLSDQTKSFANSKTIAVRSDCLISNLYFLCVLSLQMLSVGEVLRVCWSSPAVNFLDICALLACSFLMNFMPLALTAFRYLY